MPQAEMIEFTEDDFVKQEPNVDNWASNVSWPSVSLDEVMLEYLDFCPEYELLLEDEIDDDVPVVIGTPL